jgi:hypothetical protein
MAKAIELKLKAGDAAPKFSVATSGGGKISLADYKGQNVILYFYPKDDKRRGGAGRQPGLGEVARQVRGKIQAAVHVAGG